MYTEAEVFIFCSIKRGAEGESPLFPSHSSAHTRNLGRLKNGLPRSILLSSRFSRGLFGFSHYSRFFLSFLLTDLSLTDVLRSLHHIIFPQLSFLHTHRTRYIVVCFLIRFTDDLRQHKTRQLLPYSTVFPPDGFRPPSSDLVVLRPPESR